jgi:acetylornithine deacetylase
MIPKPELAVELMERLCKIPSPPGREAELIEFIAGYLAKLGYDSITDENLVLNPSKLYVTTHLDSIGEPRFRFDGRFFYGNSVCDAKASITAILLALSMIEPENLSFGVALLSDEESGGTGSKKFVEIYKPKMVVVMEPTSLGIANVHYGNLEVEVTTRATSFHGSMHEKENAIELCLKAIEEIKTLSPIKPAILSIHGGGDEYVTPDSCKAVLDFLIPPPHKTSQIVEKLEAINAEFRVLEQCEPFESIEVHSILARAFREAGLEARFCEMRTWTDGANLKATADVVVWGPGDITFCHTQAERVELEEILKASRVLMSLNKLFKNENIF